MDAELRRAELVARFMAFRFCGCASHFQARQSRGLKCYRLLRFVCDQCSMRNHTPTTDLIRQSPPKASPNRAANDIGPLDYISVKYRQPKRHIATLAAAV